IARRSVPIFVAGYLGAGSLLLLSAGVVFGFGVACGQPISLLPWSGFCRPRWWFAACSAAGAIGPPIATRSAAFGFPISTLCLALFAALLGLLLLTGVFEALGVLFSLLDYPVGLFINSFVGVFFLLE
ncbi:hypothetical protein U1Q18_037941, partial [Sarracenia purpurea var. burkii]